MEPSHLSSQQFIPNRGIGHGPDSQPDLMYAVISSGLLSEYISNTSRRTQMPAFMLISGSLPTDPEASTF